MQQSTSGLGESTAGLCIYLWEYTQKIALWGGGGGGGGGGTAGLCIYLWEYTQKIAISPPPPPQKKKML